MSVTDPGGPGTAGTATAEKEKNDERVYRVLAERDLADVVDALLVGKIQHDPTSSSGSSGASVSLGALAQILAGITIYEPVADLKKTTARDALREVGQKTGTALRLVAIPDRMFQVKSVSVATRTSVEIA